MLKHYLSKNYFLLFTVFIFLIPLVARGEKKQIDSLKLLIATPANDTAYLKNLNALSREFVNGGDYAQSLKYAEEASQFAKRKLDSIANTGTTISEQITRRITIQYAYAQYLIGYTMYDKSDFASALDYLFRSLKMSESVGDEVGQARAHVEISNICIDQGDYVKAIEHAEEAYRRYQKLHDKQGESRTFDSMGRAHLKKSNYSAALDYFTRTLNLGNEIKDQESVANSLNSIGVVYFYMGNYSKTLEYYLKALKIEEASGDKESIGMMYNNIGSIYLKQKNLETALKNYFEALKIAQEIKDRSGIARSYNNIGLIYSEQNDYPKALEYFDKALQIKDNDPLSVANTLNNIGSVYSQQKNYAQAINYYLQALKLRQSVGNNYGVAASYINIAKAKVKEGDYKNAEQDALNGFQIANESKSLELIQESNEILSEVYTKIHQTDKAFDHYKKYITARDSIYNQQNTEKIVRSEMNFQYEKEQTIQRAEQEKQELNHREAIRRKNAFIYFGVFLIVLVSVFLFVLFNRLRIIRKQKQLIETQSKNMHDSIVNAKSLQDNILPTPQFLQRILPPHFIFYQPKEIVSGDFYWAHETDGLVFIALADCTGHGVPGALMSMLGYSLLNDIVIYKKIHSPEEILNMLNREVMESLQQNSDENFSMDGGMDIAICCIDKKNNLLHISSAHQPVYIIKNGAMECIKGELFSIGWKVRGQIGTYNKVSLSMENVSALYFSSDGYSDQFGGPADAKTKRKFSSKVLEKMLVEISDLEVKEQEKKISRTFSEWKGLNSQTDDVLVMGLKF